MIRKIVVVAGIVAAAWAAGARFELVSKQAGTYGSNNNFPETSPTLHADRQQNRIQVASAGSLHLTALAGPKNNMMSFQIEGLTNPEIDVAKGSRLTINVINVDDDMAHNLYLTDQAPPYAQRVPAGSVGTSTLMPHKDGKYSGSALVVKADAAGTAYYLCTVPGHAKAGMFGKIVVK
ncbi:MAG TPA: plastocyanin/azurin family copper-binding protein [Terriglobales bacterium]|nr:plastocyanin/azurin family copper-binding protein [Terriglobales bacterium]